MIQHQSGKCVGLFGRLFGHSFQSRYSENRYTDFDTSREIRSYKFVSYDICKRCGTIVEVGPRDDDDFGEEQEPIQMLPIGDRIPSLN